MSLSCRNQSIELLCKSMNWFLYDMDLRHERVKHCQNHEPISGQRAHFITPENTRKTLVFGCFSGSMKREHSPEMVHTVSFSGIM